MLIHLDRATPVPLYQQLYRVLRDQIMTHQLPPGHRMPSTREMANAVGVARNVVLQAYEMLQADGYLEGHHGSGTFVSGALARGCTDGGGERELTGLLTPRLNAPDIHLPGPPSLAIDFRTGFPDARAFPRAIWGRLLQRAVRELPDNRFGYGPVAGSPELREALAVHLRQSRGVRTTSERLVITSGSTQGLAILADMLINPGDLVVIENPAHATARSIFQSRGARLMPIPVDDEGIQVEVLERELAQSPAAPRLIYVTPSHQFPCGGVMSLSRRTSLVAVAGRTGALIIEDDYDSEVRHTGQPVPALQGLAPSGVIYLGSFSKVLAPTLRLGYAVLSEHLTEGFCRWKYVSDYHSPGIEQQALAEFIRRGHLERHLHRVRRLYRARRETMISALSETFGRRASIHGDETGLHLWLELHSDWRGADLAHHAARAGVGVYPLEFYWHGPGMPAGCHLFLGYGSLSDAEIRKGVRILAAVERGESRVSRESNGIRSETSPGHTVKQSHSGLAPEQREVEQDEDAVDES